MRRKFLASALIFVIILSVLCVPVSAADTVEGTLDNFTVKKNYDDRFTDVKTGDWFYDNVEYLYELGLTQGQSETSFGASNTISVAEVITFAARVRSVFFYGDSEYAAKQFPGGEWYSPYLEYLKYAGAIGTEADSVMETKATREFTAHILANTLPAQAYSTLNADIMVEAAGTGMYMGDIFDTLYDEDILILYMTGICSGTDSYGNFYPKTTITRSELAAMLTRLVNESLRVEIKWELPDTAIPIEHNYRTYKSFITDSPSFDTTPETIEDYGENIRWMLKNDLNTYKYSFPGECDPTVPRDMYCDAVCLYPEFGYNGVSVMVSLNVTGKEKTTELTLTLTGDTEQRRELALEKALELHDLFWERGTITENMTEEQVAKVYYNHLATSCQYDNDFKTGCYWPSGALVDGLAVCQGYTGAYNMLLKIEGISCTVAQGPNHIWTVADLDGEEYHIDATWGDRGNYSTDKWFKQTRENSFRDHRANLGPGNYSQGFEKVNVE